jgi:uncharacterized protein (TIGR02246 family)
MTRVLLPLAALALLVGFALRPAVTEADARALAEAWVTANTDHDADAMMELLADGALFAWPDGEEAVLSDRAAFREGLTQYFANTPAQHFNATVDQVRLGRGTALVVLTGTATVAEGVTLPVHTLLAMEETADGLRITAEHTLSPISM